MNTLLRLRWMRLRRRMGRKAGNLSVYFDFWSVMHYLFAAMAYGPGVYYYWADPPPLPPGGEMVLALWPSVALMIGWGWAVLGGLFGPAAKSPLPLTKADVHLLLSSPVSRGHVLLERFLTGWARRAFGPVGLVVVVAVLVNGYHLVAWSQVGWLALIMALLALGNAGIAVTIFALGAGVRRWLGILRKAGQVLGLLSVGLAFGAGGDGVLGAAPSEAVPAWPAEFELPALPDLGGAVMPAAVFAVVAVGLAWLVGGGKDLATWTDEQPAESGGRRRVASARGTAAGIHIFRWKQRAIWRKRTLWDWLARFVAPSVGAAALGLMAGRVSFNIAGVMAALALFQVARYLAGTLGEELRHVERLRRLPERMSTFVAGSLLEVGLWLLPSALLVWLVWGAGWLALPGSVLTAGALTVLAFQQLWAERTAALSVKAGPADTAFPYLAITWVVVAGDALVRALGPASGLVLLVLGVGAGAAFILGQVYWDMMTA